jgi:hypothetical protein
MRSHQQRSWHQEKTPLHQGAQRQEFDSCWNDGSQVDAQYLCLVVTDSMIGVQEATDIYSKIRETYRL